MLEKWAVRGVNRVGEGEVKSRVHLTEGRPLDRNAVEDTLQKLARQGSLVRYPPLVEEDGVMVAQYEHSLYLSPEGVEILTA